MINYVPELTSEILSNIMRELVKLDVCIQDGMEDFDEEMEDELMEQMSSSPTLAAWSSQIMTAESEDGELSDSDESGDETNTDDDDPEKVRLRKIMENIDLVDQTMNILFSYYTTLISSTSLETRHNTMERLINQFKSFVLPTYRSRHPQFLIFHFAQSDPIIIDKFVTDCISILVDKNEPAVVRHSAAAYFAGFVGRGSRVPPSVVHDCLDLLCDQLSHLRKTYEPLCTRGPDLKRFGDFYATFQAIVYIFCFRWRAIASASSDLDDDDDDDLLNADETETYHFSHNLHDSLQAAIYSPLNPLRVCTPVIIEQFAKLVFALKFLYIFPKIEENKHIRIASTWRSANDLQMSDTSRDMSWVGDNGVMEAYFPFDPYVLPTSKHWLEDDYVHWEGIPGEEAAQEDSEDDDELRPIMEVEDGRVQGVTWTVESLE
jgi:RNA polymerase I-specific transcription initiation factor RRN3